MSPAITVGEDVTSAATLTLANAKLTLSLAHTACVGNAHLGILNWIDGNGEEKV